MSVISNYKELVSFSKSQITAQGVLNGRLYGSFAGESACWQSVIFSPDFREKVINDLCGLYGGRKKERVKYSLSRSSPPQHWALSRTFYDNERWSYCAGQDYPSELNDLRKYLYNF